MRFEIFGKRQSIIKEKKFAPITFFGLLNRESKLKTNRNGILARPIRIPRPPRLLFLFLSLSLLFSFFSRDISRATYGGFKKLDSSLRR